MIARAVLGDKMSCAAAHRAAQAGELPGQTPEDTKDFQSLSYTYACQIVREHRDELDGVQLARSQPNTVTRDAATLLLRRAQLDAKKIANAQKPLMDTGAALQTLRVIEAAQRVIQNLEPKKSAAKAETTATSKPRSLAAQIAASADTAASDLTPQTTPNEVSALALANERDITTDDASYGAARSNLAVPGAPGVTLLAGA